jgi:peptide/nickel transport system substrate-binding protein
MVLRERFVLTIFLVLVIGLAACSPEGLSTLKLPDEDQVGPEPTSYPSPVPPTVLSICLGREPESLFLYGDLSESAEIIRQAIYDGPIDLVDFQFQPIILEELPSQENGLVSLNQVEVFPGQRIVDVRGNRPVLASGVEFRPAGCSSSECWEIYEDQPSIFLDQVSVRFLIMDDITWSDGVPVTPEDSLFSYQAAIDLYGSKGPAKLRYAADYQVLEEGEIQWTGLPGYLGIYDYAELFFSPLPGHLWANYSQEELLTSPQTTLYPLGWGPYRSLEWIKGDHITLARNELYHLAEEGWPAFDYLVFRFVEDGQEALAAYTSGECDLVANTPDLVSYLPEIRSLEEREELNLLTVNLPAWEQVSFGIDSLDRSRRLLSDSQVRKAIAMCIDRETIATRRNDVGTIADNLYHPQDPHFYSLDSPLAYQPAEAEDILESLGWIDHDQDSSTPRRAEGVEGVSWGTTLQLSLLVPGAEGGSPTAEMIKDQLALCGAEVEIAYLPAGEMLAPGPVGPVFGRQFDLALFSWTTGNFHLCQIFQTYEIPGMHPTFPKGWGGTNAPGYSNPDFDQACNAALTNLPDSAHTQEAVKEMQILFADQLPVLPLFYRQEVILYHPNLEGLGPGFFPPLANIERIKLLE